MLSPQTSEAASPLGVGIKGREEKMSAERLRYMTVITEGKDSSTCGASVFVSIVSVVPTVSYFVDVSCLVVAPPFHILAVYSKEE